MRREQTRKSISQRHADMVRQAEAAGIGPKAVAKEEAAPIAKAPAKDHVRDTPEVPLGSLIAERRKELHTHNRALRGYEGSAEDAWKARQSARAERRAAGAVAADEASYARWLARQPKTGALAAGKRT